MKRLVAVAVLALGFAFGSGAQAETGKIYVNGAWVEAQKPTGLGQSTPILGSFFGGKQDLQQMVRGFLDQNASILNMGRDSSWALRQQQGGKELSTQRFEKSWRGLPVVGGDAVVHLGKSGEIAFANADATRLDFLPSRAELSAEQARALAFSSYRGGALSASEPELKVLLVGEGSQKEAKLAYKVTVRDRDQFSSDIHFIDAVNGAELLATSNVHTLNGANREILAGLGSEMDFELDETQWGTIHSDSGCGTGSFVGDLFVAKKKAPGAPERCREVDERVGTSALFAWNNSGLVFDYYQSVHKRNSIDGNGLALKSVVNFGGSSFANAAWYDDKAVMLYGVGDDAVLNDFASPLDVVAHEITHGVTARTSGLVYADESGALNESYSDVFGKLVAFHFQKGKNPDWKLGRELFKDGQQFVRDMENPEVGHTKDYLHRGESCNRFNDFCGVHTNSGIPNKAAVILAKKIGLEKLGKLYFLTLTQLLRSSSNFAEAKAQTGAACGTLFGASSADCKAVEEAFAAVGI